MNSALVCMCQVVIQAESQQGNVKQGVLEALYPELASHVSF